MAGYNDSVKSANVITGILSNATLQGDSAYEVAVKNGFVGTEAEWLASLKGDQGDQGIQGPIGPTGPTGATGNGISNIAMGSSGWMSIHTTDGTDYSFYVKGDKGNKGDTGVGISTVLLNSDYTLTITLTDGDTYTTDPIRGAKGETGTSITNVTLNSNYTLTITMSDGTSYTTDSIRGAKGDKGDTGSKGDKGTSISSVTKTGTSGLVDTYTITYDDGTTSTFTVTNGQNATVEVTSDTDGDYRLTFTDVNGSIETPNLYSDVTASAKQLLSDSYTLDQVPYLFRKSPDSDRAVEEIVGGTVGWNQLAPVLNSDNYSTTKCTVSYSDGGATISATGNYGRIGINNQNIPSLTATHKYLAYVDAKTNFAHSFFPLNISLKGNNITVRQLSVPDKYQQYALIGECGNNTTTFFYLGDVNQYYQSGDEVQVKNFMLFDLTTMFGSTIADYIYSLEQSTAGAGVAWFRKLFPKPYYEYNAGELKSVEGLVSHDMTGFNLFDEETTFTEQGFTKESDGSWKNDHGYTVTGYDIFKNNLAYSGPFCISFDVKYSVSAGSSGLRPKFYYTDGTYSNNYIDASTSFSKKTFVTNPNKTLDRIGWDYGSSEQSTWFKNFCVNISWDGSRDGEYEPYVLHSYPLDDSLTLRGIPKLDSSNNLYYDGDVYPADGQGKRRFTERAYQSGDESLADAITDGTTTVVKLSTPTTFTALPYHNPQIVGDTEEFVTTGIVPVGHATKYFLDLKSRIEGLPDDFSTLIAPTEVTNKATKNYTKGELLILNNQLYKVTTAIANNGTITVNTNVRATTIAQEISPLVPPTTNGTYVLKATVSNGNVTYSWVAG